MSEDIFASLSALPGAAADLGAGQAVFCRGDAVRRLYLVVAGDVRLVRYLEDG